MVMETTLKTGIEILGDIECKGNGVNIYFRNFIFVK